MCWKGADQFERVKNDKNGICDMSEILQTVNISDNFERGTDANNLLTGTQCRV